MKLVHFWDKSYRHKEGVNGVQAIYANNLLRTLAFSLGGLFSPLYIFLLGFLDVFILSFCFCANFDFPSCEAQGYVAHD